jgi:hypothetical protein
MGDASGGRSREPRPKDDCAKMAERRDRYDESIIPKFAMETP